MLTENSIWFRHQATARKAPPHWLQWLAYPSFVLAPGLFIWVWVGRNYDPCSSDSEFLLYLTLFLHIFYFAARSLMVTVGVVAREKDRGTFHSLQGTLTTPGEILIGHLAVNLVPRLGELALVGPLVLMLYWNDLTFAQWASLMATSGAVIFAYGALGMAFSTCSCSVFQAGQRAFSALAALFVGTLWFDAVMDETGGFDKMWLSIPLNPLLAVITIVNPADADWLPHTWGLLCLTHLIAGGLLMLLVLRRLGSPEDGRGRTRRRSGRLRLPWLSEHPLLFRELRLERLWLYPVLMVTPMVAIPLLTNEAYGLRTGFHIAIFIHLLYFCFRALSRAVTSVSTEREHQTLDSLLSTQLSGSELYRGKLAAVVLPLLLEMLMFAPLLMGLSLFEVVELPKLLGLLVITAVMIVFLATLGIWASARFGSTARAAWVVAAFVGFTFVGGAVFDLIISVVDHHGGDFFVGSMFSPLMAFLTLLWEEREVHVWAGCPAIYLLATLVLARKTGRLFRDMAGG